MKKIVIIIFAALLVVMCISIFFLNIYCPECGTYISAEKLDHKPETYVKFTQNDLNRYPYVQKAINDSGSMIKIPFNGGPTHEFNKILWENNRTQNFEVDDEYYRFFMISAD